MAPINCPACGHSIENDQVAFCPNCGAGVQPTPDSPGEPGGLTPPMPQEPPPPVNSVPFEDPSLPFVQRFVDTAKMALTDPVRLFSGMSDGDFGAPLLYGVIVGTITTIFSIIWNMAFGGLAMLGGGIPADEMAIGAGMYFLIMLISPVLVAVGLFITTAFFHLGLMILGGARRGFAVTFRAVAYGNTPALLAVVPFCGGLIGGIWTLVLVIMGGKYGHDTDTWRAILGYFILAIVCCCVVFGLGMTFGMLGSIFGSN